MYISNLWGWVDQFVWQTWPVYVDTMYNKNRGDIFLHAYIDFTSNLISETPSRKNIPRTSILSYARQISLTYIGQILERFWNHDLESRLFLSISKRRGIVKENYNLLFYYGNALIAWIDRVCGVIANSIALIKIIIICHARITARWQRHVPATSRNNEVIPQHICSVQLLEHFSWCSEKVCTRNGV